MSTSEQPDTPPLTRKQLREIRNTGATPIITVTDDDLDDTDGGASSEQHTPVSAVPTPLPHASEPAIIAAAPVSDASVDLGVSPLTRRQARQQERIRTASVPVITPDMAAGVAAPEPAEELVPAVADEAAPDAEPAVDAEYSNAPVEASEIPTEPPVVEAELIETDRSDVDVAEQDAADEPVADAAQQIADAADDGDEEAERPVVNPEFGASLLAAEPVTVALPASFDQLIAREASSTGSVSTPHALILSQTPSSGPMLGPIGSTGEVLITGSLVLPEGLGSTGHTPGTTDGKEADAVLIDGELPAHSS
ncbi:MAG: hypothetical protein KKH75_07370, partial [Actinobacteria bacterium]|nr:hypothetical protein [Actinomycetota bacterium]